MSKTPRTDAGLIMVEIRTPFYDAILTSQKEVVYASFARELETELADKDQQLVEARAEIERQDALLEKCLGLLKQQKERGE